VSKTTDFTSQTFSSIFPGHPSAPFYQVGHLFPQLSFSSHQFDPVKNLCHWNCCIQLMPARTLMFLGKKEQCSLLLTKGALLNVFCLLGKDGSWLRKKKAKHLKTLYFLKQYFADHYSPEP
jgi:hypothetical protein